MELHLASYVCMAHRDRKKKYSCVSAPESDCTTQSSTMYLQKLEERAVIIFQLSEQH